MDNKLICYISIYQYRRTEVAFFSIFFFQFLSFRKALFNKKKSFFKEVFNFGHVLVTAEWSIPPAKILNNGALMIPVRNDEQDTTTIDMAITKDLK